MPMINKKAQLKTLLFGLAVLSLLTYLAYGLAGGLQDRLSQNPLLIAILLGIFIGNVFTVPKKMHPAIDFSITYFIKAGIVLVGLKISVQVIVNMGYEPALVAISELVSVFLITYFFLRKIMKFEGQLPILLSAGCAVCGAAAILSIALITKSNQKLVVLSVTMITLMGTVQLFLYPYLYHSGYLERFNDQLFGIFAGASIYELAQVYGAGYAVSDTAINFSTLTKLIKIIMLIPLIFIVSYFYNNKEKNKIDQSKYKIPWFILLFILVVALNSLFTINGTVKNILGQVGAFMFLMPMIALGLKTNLRNIAIEHNVKKIVFSGIIIISYTTIISYYYTQWASIDVQLLSDEKENSLIAIIRDPVVKQYGGREIFMSIGCEKCHVESLPTKDGGQLSLYSDLLIHDMGPALDDKITQGLARGTDWRTTPLAGIGNRSRYLHDGRAFTYWQAIIAHEGEAKIVRDRFIDLDDKEKKHIYEFLDSLK